MISEGTGTRASINRPLAGKTGTNSDYGDAWFVGYTPQLTTSVWIGYPEGVSKPLTNVHGIKVSGGTLPADIFASYMGRVLEGVEAEGFAGPEESLLVAPTTTTSSTTSTSTTSSTTTSTTNPPRQSTTTSTPSRSERQGGTTTTVR